MKLLLLLLLLLLLAYFYRIAISVIKTAINMGPVIVNFPFLKLFTIKLKAFLNQRIPLLLVIFILYRQFIIANIYTYALL